jgi:hypothetical protein
MEQGSINFRRKLLQEDRPIWAGQMMGEPAFLKTGMPAFKKRIEHFWLYIKDLEAKKRTY